MLTGPVFLAAGLLDAWVGDPEGWPHPVRALGWVIARLDRGRRGLTSPALLRVLGLVMAVGLPFAVGYAMDLLLWVGWRWAWALNLVLGAWMLAGRSLRDAVRPVAEALAHGQLDAARRAVGRVVGRDTEQLDTAGVARAGLETLAESTCDGVVAPLFWFAVGGLPWLWAFKTVSTLDSMVGHREAPWTHFGWASARLDDLLNWIPARLTVLLVALIAGSLTPLRFAWRDGRKTDSPNAGLVEAAFAGALHLQLGGTNQYDGVPKAGPLLGEPGCALDARALARGLDLALWIHGAALALLALGVAALRGHA